MPIGKNAIKRVSNNGYSNVKTTAPDMENSVVLNENEEKVEKTPIEIKSVVSENNATEKKVAQKNTTVKKPSTSSTKSTPKLENEKTVTKKTTAKKSAPKKSMETEPTFSPVKTAEKIVENNKNEREGDGYVNLGGKLPIHLL